MFLRDFIMKETFESLFYAELVKAPGAFFKLGQELLFFLSAQFSIQGQEYLGKQLGAIVITHSCKGFV
jgi:hypothetical protein